jgi:hypothetical protein
MKKTYKVSLRQIHVQDIVVDAVSKADAIRKALDHDGEYGNGTEYFEDMEDGHEVEEI